jgi:hypothetical protein
MERRGEGPRFGQGRWGEELGAPKMRLLCALLRAGFEPFLGRATPLRFESMKTDGTLGDATSTERLKTGARISQPLATSAARRVLRPTVFRPTTRHHSAQTVSPATIVRTARPFRFQLSKGVLRDRDKDSCFL